MSSHIDCLRDAESVLITTPDPYFAKLAPNDFVGCSEHVTVIDCWRLMGIRLSGHPKIRYVPMGRYLREGSDDTILRRLWDNLAL